MPMIRPGAWRTNASRVAKNAACGPAVAERHTEPLRVADHGVGAHFTGRGQQRERHQIARDCDKHASGVRLLDDRTQVGNLAPVVRVLQQHAERFVERQGVGVADHQPDIERFRAAADDVDGLGKAAVRHHEHRFLASGSLLRLQPVEHRHGFRRRGAFVEQRRGGDVHAGEILHHRLEIQQRFEPTLRDLSLVGRIGRVPSGILENVAKDDARRYAVVISHPDIRARHQVPIRDIPETAQIAMLGIGLRQVERSGAADPWWNRLLDQRVECGDANRAKHRIARVGVGADMPGLKRSWGVCGHRSRFSLLREFSVFPASNRSDVSDGSATLTAIIHEP